jgi:hypothetical protein
MVTFGVPLCCANAPDEVWEEYEKVMDGLQDTSVDIHSGQYLSTFMMSPPDKGKHMKVYFMHHVQKGALLVLDYARGYASNSCDTVLHILSMHRTDRVHYFKLYDNIARSVSPKVREHFLDYIERTLELCKPAKPPAVTPAPAAAQPLATYTCATTNLRLCDNAACRERMQGPLVCARCKTAAYCSKACQTAAWKTHKPECAAPK